MSDMWCVFYGFIIGVGVYRIVGTYDDVVDFNFSAIPSTLSLFVQNAVLQLNGGDDSSNEL